MLVLERLIETLKDAGAVFSRLDAVAREFDARAPFAPTYPDPESAAET